MSIKERISQYLKYKGKKAMRKVKNISIPSKIIKEIAAEVGCTDRTVYGAINFRTDGEQPERIRELALKKGGIVSHKMVG